MQAYRSTANIIGSFRMNYFSFFIICKTGQSGKQLNVKYNVLDFCFPLDLYLSLPAKVYFPNGLIASPNLPRKHFLTFTALHLVDNIV